MGTSEISFFRHFTRGNKFYDYLGDEVYGYTAKGNNLRDFLFASLAEGGGRVVLWCWVNFLLIGLE